MFRTHFLSYKPPIRENEGPRSQSGGLLAFGSFVGKRNPDKRNHMRARSHAVAYAGIGLPALRAPDPRTLAAPP